MLEELIHRMETKEKLRYAGTWIAVISALGVLAYYSIEYIKHNELVFSKEDSFILKLIFILFLIVSLALAYLSYQIHKIRKAIETMAEEMSTIEDNISETSCTQFIQVMDMLNKISGRKISYEKESYVPPDSEMD